MKVTKTDIEGVVILTPRIFIDERGYFFESWSRHEFEEKIGKIDFCQDNELVRCIKGRVLDVAVDIRKGSPTYGKHVAVELTEDNHRQMFIPKGFAHGFSVLSETALFQYKCDNFYHPEADGGISLEDETLGIDWKIPDELKILSEKDKRHIKLNEFDSPFSYDK